MRWWYVCLVLNQKKKRIVESQHRFTVYADFNADKIWYIENMYHERKLLQSILQLEHGSRFNTWFRFTMRTVCLFKLKISLFISPFKSLNSLLQCYFGVYAAWIVFVFENSLRCVIFLSFFFFLFDFLFFIFFFGCFVRLNCMQTFATDINWCACEYTVNLNDQYTEYYASTWILHILHTFVCCSMRTTYIRERENTNVYHTNI